jgi:DNA modification methylase
MAVELSWPGKRTPAQVEPARFLLIETFEPRRFAAVNAAGHPAPPTETVEQPYSALYHGDNLSSLAYLLDQGFGGAIRLIYADPPYDSGVDWTRKVRLRGPKTPGVDPVVMQQMQYADRWTDGAYLQFIYDRLPLLRMLLADNGSLWLHCDHRHAHHLRCLLDEVFGAENYLNTITWRSQTARGAKRHAFYFPNSAHTILVYARNRAAPTCWNAAHRHIELTERQAAADFMRDERGFFRTSDPGAYTFESLKRLAGEGRLYAPFGGDVVVDEAQRRVFASNGGNLGVKYHLTALGDGRYRVERGVDNIWDDIPGLGTKPGEDLGYPTQKTEMLLERVLATGSRSDDWVLDPFCGSGTTPAVAARLGRRWIACDANYGAIQTTVRRLQAVCQQLSTSAGSVQPDTTAAKIGFSVYAASSCSPDIAVNHASEPSLSITRIGADRATIEVIVHSVQMPALQDVVGNLADLEWRTFVESIAIDPAYDGKVFRAVVADAPLKKRAMVSGRYTLHAPTLPTTVAVRIVDIAGNEHMVARWIDE